MGAGGGRQRGAGEHPPILWSGLGVLGVAVGMVALGVASQAAHDHELDGTARSPSWVVFVGLVVWAAALVLTWRGARGSAPLLAVGIGGAAVAAVALAALEVLADGPAAAQLAAGLVTVVAMVWSLSVAQRAAAAGAVVAMCRAAHPTEVGHAVAVSHTPRHGLTVRERAALERLEGEGFVPIHEIGLGGHADLRALLLGSPGGAVIGEVVLGTGDETIPDGPAGFTSVATARGLRLVTKERSRLPPVVGEIVQCLPGQSTAEMLAAHLDACELLAERGIVLDRLEPAGLVDAWLGGVVALRHQLESQPVRAVRDLRRHTRGDHSVGRLRDRPDALAAFSSQ